MNFQVQKSLKKSFFKNKLDASEAIPAVNSSSDSPQKGSPSHDGAAAGSHDSLAASHDSLVTNGVEEESHDSSRAGSEACDNLPMEMDTQEKLTRSEKLASFAFKST